MNDHAQPSEIKAAAELQPGGVDPMLRDALVQIEANLEKTAADISRDMFRQDGAGVMGMLFRSINSHQPQRQRDEAWSSLIDLSTRLWQEGHQEAALKLLSDARLRLAVPDLFADTIDGSIEFGEDSMQFDKIKRAFEAGEEEVAEGLIARMHNPQEAERLRSEIKTLSVSRKKGRRLAFIAAGAFTLGLTIATGFGINSFINFAKNPPQMTLPDLDLPTHFSAMVSQPAPNPLEPDAVQERDEEQSTALSPSAVIWGTADEIREEPKADEPVSPLEQKTELTEAVEAPPPPETSIEDCALAFAVVERLQDIDWQSQTPGASAAAEQFQAAFTDACLTKIMTTSGFDQLVDEVPAEDVEEILARIAE